MTRIGGLVASRGMKWAWNIMPMTVNNNRSHYNHYNYYIWRSQTNVFATITEVSTIRALDFRR